MKKILLIQVAILSLINCLYGQVTVPMVTSGGPIGSGSWLEFTSGGAATSIQEQWGLNITGGPTQPVKIFNSSLLVGYPSVGTNYGVGNAYISGNVGIGTLTPTTMLSLLGGAVNLGTNQGQYTLSAIDNSSTTPLATGTNLLGLNAGDLMLRSYWGVSIDLNDGMQGDGVSATYSRIPLTSSFTINSRTSLTAFTTLFAVRNNGNVLIGKTSQLNATYKLDVAGNVRANQIVVNTTGADFVFEPTYSLLSLSDLKRYIDQNHHLPEIESAKQMQTDGLNVGENQTKLLQKVEELTLYLIEKDKTEVDQQKQISAQKTLLEKLGLQLNAAEELLKKQAEQLNKMQKQIEALVATK